MEPQAKRDETNAVGDVEERLFANDDGFQAFEVEFWNHWAGPVYFLLFGEQKSSGPDLENIDDLCRNAIQQLDDVAGFQQALAEGVQFFDFAAARGSILRLLASARRQVASQHRHNEKGEKGNPVLRIGDGEPADRRQEVVVEREHGGDRHENGDGDAPNGGYS